MGNLRRAFLLPVGVLLAVGLASCATGPEPSAPTPASAVPAVVPAASAPQPVLVGTVLSVMDGDTIKVQLSSGPVAVRFDSIDAPEKSQPWGREAYAELVKRLDQQVVSLEVMTQDRYDRLVAVVYLGDENINGWLVQQGHAWAYRQYLSETDYCHWEASARSLRRGLWSLPDTTWYAPWEWRQVQRGNARSFTDYSRETAGHCVGSMQRTRRTFDGDAPLATAAATQPPGRCLIKGNISQNGRIYHVPGSASYDVTKIDESAGERWFCSEAEALAAGWRAPQRP